MSDETHEEHISVNGPDDLLFEVFNQCFSHCIQKTLTEVMAHASEDSVKYLKRIDARGLQVRMLVEVDFPTFQLDDMTLLPERLVVSEETVTVEPGIFQTATPEETH
jgi:hypothetical protein